MWKPNIVIFFLLSIDSKTVKEFPHAFWKALIRRTYKISQEINNRIFQKLPFLKTKDPVFGKQ